MTTELNEMTLELKRAKDDFTSARNEIKAAQDEILAQIKVDSDAGKELKSAVDKALFGFNVQAERLNDIEQKFAERAAAPAREVKTWGEQFVESKAFKGAQERYGSFAGAGSRGMAIGTEVKTITLASTGFMERQPRREQEVISLERQRFVLRDLIPSVSTQESSIEYAVQTLRDNRAEVVPEGGIKPYSDYAWSNATAPTRVIAHLAKITRQAMDDAPRLIGEIDSEMRYGLGFKEEQEFLYGSGTGNHLFGIMPQAVQFTRPTGMPQMVGATSVDALRVAMLSVSLSQYPADAIVVSQLDWGIIELTKTADGGYLFANPQGTTRPGLWGLPVVASQAMAVGDYLVGAFRIGATIYDRMGVEVRISDENVDDFERNLLTMRAEERVGIAVKRPQAFVKGSLATTRAALAA